MNGLVCLQLLGVLLLQWQQEGRLEEVWILKCPSSVLCRWFWGILCPNTFRGVLNTAFEGLFLSVSSAVHIYACYCLLLHTEVFLAVDRSHTVCYSAQRATMVSYSILARHFSLPSPAYKTFSLFYQLCSASPSPRWSQFIPKLCSSVDFALPFLTHSAYSKRAHITVFSTGTVIEPRYHQESWGLIHSESRQ